MSDYTDAAPNVSKLATEAQFRNAFPPPPAPPAPPPEPTAGTQLELLQAYAAEYTSNGGAVDLGALARAVNVPLRWAQICDREVHAAIAALYAAEPE